MATIKICDICGKTPTKTFYFSYDDEWNGVERDVKTESFDLCFDHTEYLVNVLKGWLQTAGIDPETEAPEVYVSNRKIINFLQGKCDIKIRKGE
jgi:hypothetical protein